jgi:hypothetical protein
MQALFKINKKEKYYEIHKPKGEQNGNYKK